MRLIVEFLSLRPIWTRRGLELAWYAYLVTTLIQEGFYIRVIYSGARMANAGYLLSVVNTILIALIHLVLVRIFLEMALKFLVPHREDANV